MIIIIIIIIMVIIIIIIIILVVSIARYLTISPTYKHTDIISPTYKHTDIISPTYKYTDIIKGKVQEKIVGQSSASVCQGNDALSDSVVRSDQLPRETSEAGQ